MPPRPHPPASRPEIDEAKPSVGPPTISPSVSILMPAQGKKAHATRKIPTSEISKYKGVRTATAPWPGRSSKLAIVCTSAALTLRIVVQDLVGQDLVTHGFSNARVTRAGRGGAPGHSPGAPTLLCSSLGRPLYTSTRYCSNNVVCTAWGAGEAGSCLFSVKRDKLSTTGGRGEVAEIYQPVQRLASSHSPPKSQANI